MFFPSEGERAGLGLTAPSSNPTSAASWKRELRSQEPQLSTPSARVGAAGHGGEELATRTVAVARGQGPGPGLTCSVTVTCGIMATDHPSRGCGLFTDTRSLNPCTPRGAGEVPKVKGVCVTMCPALGIQSSCRCAWGLPTAQGPLLCPLPTAPPSPACSWGPEPRTLSLWADPSRAIRNTTWQ